jgi:hypothetical protein
MFRIHAEAPIWKLSAFGIEAASKSSFSAEIPNENDVVLHRANSAGSLRTYEK